MNRENKQRAFSLLLAVLVGSLLISIGLGIFNLALKDATLSASGRESQFALYAADSGIECAIYWDASHGAGGTFATSSSGTTGEIGANVPHGVDCSGTSGRAISVKSVNDGMRASTSTFQYNLSSSGQTTLNSDQPCVTVEVSKTEPTVGANIKTFINARGYNTCDPNNTRRVERGLYINY